MRKRSAMPWRGRRGAPLGRGSRPLFPRLAAGAQYPWPWRPARLSSSAAPYNQDKRGRAGGGRPHQDAGLKAHWPCALAHCRRERGDGRQTDDVDEFQQAEPDSAYCNTPDAPLWQRRRGLMPDRDLTLRIRANAAHLQAALIDGRFGALPRRREEHRVLWKEIVRRTKKSGGRYQKFP